MVRDSTDPNRGVAIGYDPTLESGFQQAGKSGIGYRPMLINPNGGNVGIRTTVPASTLDIAGSIGVAGGYFQNGCPSGTTLRATNLCMDNSDRTAAAFQEAQAVCRALGAPICTYYDVYSAWPNGNTVGNWLGNRDGDDSCLHINGTAQSNFEGSTNKGDSRAYRCCFGPYTP